MKGIENMENNWTFEPIFQYSASWTETDMEYIGTHIENNILWYDMLRKVWNTPSSTVAMFIKKYCWENDIEYRESVRWRRVRK